ncbi:MAG: hypothetical protein ACRCXA_04805 [Peptostreptococcaceae bacterium]
MKKKQIVVIFTIMLALIAYLIGTPTGALRFSVLREGYPIKSITMKLSDTPYEIDIKSNEQIYTLINPPIEKSTQGILENWVVSQYGIFYWGEYFGW